MERAGSNGSDHSEIDLTALHPLEAEALDLVTVILGHASLLASMLPATDPGRVDVERIAGAARRLTSIVSQICRPPADDTCSEKLQGTIS